MNIVPSLVEGYLYSEMYHLEGGGEGCRMSGGGCRMSGGGCRMSGGYPLQDVVASGDTMVGGGHGFANLVVPIGLVCDMRVAPRHIEYVNHYDDEDVPFMDEALHDSLFGNVTSRKNGSRKKHLGKSSKRKSIRYKIPEK